MKKIIYIICCFCWMLFSTNSSFAQTVVTYNYTGGAQTWTVPAGVTTCTVYCFGGGGGGGGVSSFSYSWFANGGGGGGGACSKNIISVTPTNVYNITIGAGGAGGTTGAAGGTTTFSGAAGSFTAAGGGGGTVSNGAGGTHAGGAGGSTGTGTVYSGGNGSSGNDGTSSTTGRGGQGGGGGGSGGNGTTPALTCAGTGTGGTGTYPGGNGGYNNTSCPNAVNVAGVAGSVPGGGGSAYYSWSQTSAAGAAGGNGRVVIEYDPCVTPTTQASAINFSSVGCGSMTVNWTNGNGTKRVVKMNTSNSFTSPADGTDPAANTVWGGSEQVVYNNSGSSVTVTNLAVGTTYWFRVWDYNCTGASTKYISTTSGTNPLSKVTLPTTAAPSSATANPSTVCTGGTSTLTANGSLVAYYPFSANVNDASGNGLNLTGAGGTFTGGGIQLTSASAYASALTEVLNTDKYTIDFYMQYTAPADGSWRKIFGYSAGGSDRSPGLWRYPAAMQLHWRHDPGNTGLGEAKIYTQGQWYHVVGEKNGATLSLYVDGVLVESGAVANPKTAGEAALWFGGADVLLKEFKIYNGIIRWYTGSCGGTAAGSGPTVTVTPGSTTTYYVRAEGACVTSTCATTVVTVAAPSTPNAGPDQYICSTQGTAVMAATGTGTWTQISGPAVAGLPSSTANITLTLAGSGTYEFRWTSSCGGTYDDMVVVKQ